MSKRYCCVIKCKHFVGTSNKDVHMFRVPLLHEDLRAKWVKAIETANGSKFNAFGRVCNLHFNDEDLKMNGNRLTLMHGAIPIKFLQSAENVESTHSCKRCEQLESENAHLKTLLNNSKKIIELERIRFEEKLTKSERNNIEKSKELSSMKIKLTSLRKTAKETQEKDLLFQTKVNKSQEEVIRCLLSGIKSNNKYPESVREFCLGLHYHSPRSYEYVRKKFNDNLPHVGTLRQWYCNSNLVSEPGINPSVLNHLKDLAFEKKNQNQELIVSLSCDEMNIRKHVHWCNSTKQLLGISNISNDNETPKVAKQALVFMVNGVNEIMNIPLAHYFITSLDAISRKNLLLANIHALIESDVIVSNVTFDGLSANKKMCRLLGANLDTASPDFNSSICIAEHGPIQVIFDNCHMLKLVRNALGNKGTLYDQYGEKIEWCYIKKLVGLSKSHGFAMTHKLTRAHLQWKRNVMKVNLAVQTLSQSVADSLQLLIDMNVEEFQGALPTIKFIRIFNQLFDVFNTKSTNSEGKNEFKNAINSKNECEIFNFLQEAKDYIMGLQLKNGNDKMIKITKSKIQTGFSGFIINIQSLEKMYARYVRNGGILTRINTWMVSQDPLELFFGKIRSLNGFNDNPTVQQFSAAHRKLLGNFAILNSQHGNCKPAVVECKMKNILMSVSSRKSKTQTVRVHQVGEIQNLSREIASFSGVDLNIFHNGFNDITTAHIANMIEGKIKKSQIYCGECVNVFAENEKVENAFSNSKFNEKPCRSTFEICEVVETYMKLENLLKCSNFQSIDCVICNEIAKIENLYSNTDFSHDTNHKAYLIRFIIDACINIKGTFIAREATFDEHEKFMRSQCRKFIHFKGQ